MKRGSRKDQSFLLRDGSNAPSHTGLFFSLLSDLSFKDVIFFFFICFLLIFVGFTYNWRFLGVFGYKNPNTGFFILVQSSS